jgi:hypothetical protein
VNGVDFVGVLCGRNYKGTISSCYALGNSDGNRFIGGLLGHNHIGSVSKSYSFAAVNGVDYLGGFCGRSYHGSIAQCYSMGSVSGTRYYGGFTGLDSSANITFCFWDKDTSGQTISSGGVGKTTAQMMTQSTFSGWDFVSTWTMNDYPALQWQIPLFSDGSGTENDPYLISSKDDLLNLGRATSLYDKHFKQTADIDLAGENFTRAVIAPDVDSETSNHQGTKFSGGCDGNEYSIRNLEINGNGDFIGLFGCVDDSKLLSIHLVDADVSGSDFVGVLCGRNEKGVVNDCMVSGHVDGNKFIGGVAGHNYSGTLTRCSSSGDVNGVDFVGVLCGRNYKGTISSCYASGIASGNRFIGGLLGHNHYGSVNKSYSFADVSGVDYLGGFCGRSYQGSIAQCYSKGRVSGTEYYGGLTGLDSSANITSCFWDKNTSGVTISSGGIGKTTTQMKTQSTFSGWDFVNTWTMNGYPVFKWQLLAGQTAMACAPEKTSSGTSAGNNNLASLVDPYEPSSISVQFDCTQYLSEWGIIRLSDIDGYSMISSLDDDDYYKVFLSAGWYDVGIECDILNWSPLSVILYNCCGEWIDSVNNENLAPLVIDTDLYVSESGYYYIGIHPWWNIGLPTTEYPVKYDLDIKFLKW